MASQKEVMSLIEQEICKIPEDSPELVMHSEKLGDSLVVLHKELFDLTKSHNLKLKSALEHQLKDLKDRDMNLNILRMIEDRIVDEEQQVHLQDNQLRHFRNASTSEDEGKSNPNPQKKDLSHIKDLLDLLIGIILRKYTSSDRHHVNFSIRMDKVIDEYKNLCKENSVIFNKDVVKKLAENLEEYPDINMHMGHDKVGFHLVHMRILNLIWDKIASSAVAVNAKAKENNESNENKKEKIDPEQELLKRNVNYVHIRYLEAHAMWLQRLHKERAEKAIEPHWVEKLDQIVLWNIVSQCSGTIAHSPEKVCEIYDFVHLHVKSKGVPSNFVGSLLAIFSQYYQEILAHHINFEDVNMDALKQKDSTQKSIQMTASEKTPLLHLEDEDDDINKTVSVFDLYFAGQYCLEHKKVHQHNPHSGKRVAGESTDQCRYVELHFPTRGGIFGALVAFGWLLRIHLWILFLAWFLIRWQNANKFQECSEASLPYLAIADCSIFFLVNALRFHVVGKLRKIHLLVFLYSFAWLAGIGLSMYSNHSTFKIIPYPAYIIEGYLASTLVLFVVGEIKNAAKTCCFPIKGRNNAEKWGGLVAAGFWIGAPLIMIALAALDMALIKYVPSLTPILTYYIGLVSLILGVDILATSTFACFAGLIGGALLGHFLANSTLRRKKGLSGSEINIRKRRIWAETKYLVGNICFWTMVALLYWVTVFQFLVPSVINIGTHLCVCDDQDVKEARIRLFTTNISQTCNQRVTFICNMAVVLTWAGAVLVSLVISNMCFNLVMIASGVFIAISNRIGDITTWRQVPRNFRRLKVDFFPTISDSMKIPKNHVSLWNSFVNSLFEENLLTMSERTHLLSSPTTSPNFSRPPRNEEARRRIIKFCWSLEAMHTHDHRTAIEEHRKDFQVKSMPSWTVMVPCATETTFYSQRELLRPKETPRISLIEYLVGTYPDEWDNFCATLRSNATDGKTILEQFLTPKPEGNDFKQQQQQVQYCTAQEIEKICHWASCRGQTLYRTIRGLINYREGLIKLAELEEGIETSMERQQKQIQQEVVEYVNRKFQIIIALQIYNPDKITEDWNGARKAAFDRMLKYLSQDVGRHNAFDLVFNSDDNQHSMMVRFDGVNYDMKNCQKYVIKRPGRLIVGEPKAENQSHALPFALNEVIQVNDMNMYNSIENAFKIPFLLNCYFNVPDEWVEQASVIPEYRMVGFPEHTYSRSLSMVGELMGSAEFCFVTITQRVLGALRVRLHYGHPDFVDGYWVRTRGGVSKASHLVNTNEDIYTGYEMIGRGEKIAYVEFIEEQKGRESGFHEAFTFEAKLAQGAAQQIRSPEVYHLNNNLPLFMRLSLFYGTLGFYITSMLMDVSIDLYMLSLLLYATAGVDSDALGLLKAVIAVPWMLQIGYVNCFPFLAELIINQGFWDGIVTFLIRLPFSLVFFVFHLRTKSYFFSQGLLVGKGGYKGTGRGFGLDRVSLVDIFKFYYDSHFHNAMVMLAAICFYGVVSNESRASFFFRLGSILLVIFSWITAPIIFNPYATSDNLSKDVKHIHNWISTNFSQGMLQDPEVHIANAELHDAKRKDRLNRWMTEKHTWQGWFLKTIIDEWEEEDKWSSTALLTKVKHLLQKLVNLTWQYLPWFVVGQFYWRAESLYYIGVILPTFIFFAAIDARYTNQNEHFTIWKAILFLCIPPVIVFFYYGHLTFPDLLVSTLLHTMFFFILMDFGLGLYNLYVKFSIKKTSWEGEMDEKREMLIPRLLAPRFLTGARSIWPYAAMILLAGVSLITVTVSGGLTTLLFNGRVADMWHRAYLQKC